MTFKRVLTTPTRPKAIFEAATQAQAAFDHLDAYSHTEQEQAA